MPSFKIKKPRRLTAPSKPLWQRTQTIKRTNGNRRKMWVSVALLLALFALILAGFIYRAMTSGTWEGKEQFNFLVGAEGERVLLISLDPESTNVLVFDLNPNVMIETVYGYGDYKIGSLLRLGRMEKLGSDLLQESVQHTFGMKMADVLPVSTATVQVINAAYIQRLAKPMLVSLLGRPLGISDVWRYISATSSLRDDQVTVISLHESRLAYSEPPSDESIELRLDQQRLDGFIQAQIHGTNYINEKIGVSIINTTSHPGLASSLSRISLNSGIDVISVGESQDTLATSAVIYDKPETADSETVRLIRELLPGSTLTSKSEAIRADVVVLLGEDYNDYLTKRPR